MSAKNKKKLHPAVAIVLLVLVLFTATRLAEENRTHPQDGIQSPNDSSLTGDTADGGAVAMPGKGGNTTTTVSDSTTAHTAGSTTAKTTGKTTAKQTTTNRLPNLPASYKSHVYLDSRHTGGCDTPKGAMKLVIVFVDDSFSQWNDATLAEAKAAHQAAVDAILQDAKQFGQKLTITIEHKTATTSGEPEGDQARSWVDGALKSAGLPARDGLNDALEKKYNVNEAPVLFCVNRSGRSYSKTNTSGEYAILYDDDDNVLRHELYHLFGAQDYYFPADVKKLAEGLFADSIMLSSSYAAVDELTAYNIGWTDTPSAKVKEFLEKTTYLTYDLLAKEKEKDSHTGQVTDFDLGYATFTGYLRRGIPEGSGTMVYSNGNSYSGAWAGGKQNGQGTFIWKESGNKYVGAWKDGTRTGKGTITYKNGASYTGEWKNSVFHGQGTYTYAGGGQFTGIWENGEKNGQGTFTYANGNVYTGAFKDDLRHGQGTMTYADGGQFVGTWESGKKNGQGTFTYANGNVYTGAFKDDLRHGQGTMTYANGDSYSGDWQNGKQHGQGTYIWKEASHKYTGGWKDGQRHGQGVYTFEDGSTKTGTWENDKFVG